MVDKESRKTIQGLAFLLPYKINVRDTNVDLDMSLNFPKILPFKRIYAVLNDLR